MPQSLRITALCSTGILNDPARRVSTTAAAGSGHYFYAAHALSWATFCQVSDGTALDLSAFDLLELRLCATAADVEAPLMVSTAAPGACTPEAWTAGTDAHATFEWTAEEANIDMLRRDSRELVWFLFGVDGTETHPLASGIVIARGTGTSGEPAGTPALYATAAELAAVESNIIGTDLSATAGSSTVTVASSTGNDAVLTAATSSAAGVMTAAQVVSLAAALAASQATRVLEPSADPTTDRRAEIQALWDYFAPAGGVIVELYPAATYRITTVNSPATGSKAGGAYGLEVRTNCGLRGQGPSTVVEIHAGGSFGTGCGISPYGMRDAASDYGAASDVLLENFTLRASGQVASSGNLLNLVHCQRWLIRGVTLGASYYHGLECSKSRDIAFERCRWDGEHGFATSGSHVQFDGGAGDSGPQSLTPTTTTVERVSFADCWFGGMGTSGGGRMIELTHSNTMTAQDISFRRCRFEGRPVANYYIMDIAGSGPVVKRLTVEDCTFVTAHYDGWAFNCTADTCVLDGIYFRRNRFTGPALVMFQFGGSFTTESYNTNHANRRNIVFEDNRIEWDKTQLPASRDQRLVAFAQCYEVTFRGNYIDHIGAKPGGSNGVGNGTAAMLRIINCRNAEITGNTWVMDSADVATAMAMRIYQTQADAAGETERFVVSDNVFRTANAGWTWGIVYNGTAGTAPKAWAFERNSLTGAANSPYAGTLGGWEQNSGGASDSVRTITGNTTLTAADSVLLCNTASGSITITFPHVSMRQRFTFIKTSASNSLIVGGVTVTAINSVVMSVSDGTTRTSVQIA